MIDQILTTSEIDEEIVLCKLNGLRHLFNELKACLSVHLTVATVSKAVLYWANSTHQNMPPISSTAIAYQHHCIHHYNIRRAK